METGAGSNGHRWVLGRAADCDYVINHASVSNRHALLEELATGRFRLTDLGSTNGTFVGPSRARISAVELQGDEMLYFSPRYSVPAIVLLQQLKAGSSGVVGRQLDLGQDRITIGRALDNDVCLTPLTVSRHHAEITRREGGRIYIRDLDTKLGTVVNGRVLKKGVMEILPDANIEIGGCRISLDFSPAVAEMAKVAVDRTGFTLRVSNLGFKPSPGGAALVTDFSVVVYPGELTAVMGPSGCGKSTLLNLLTGESGPYSGSVAYDGVELGEAPGMILPYIAHVPQDDYLNPDLTVRETLHGYARVRLPADLSREEIDAKIDDVCRKLALFDERKGVDLRDRLIGSPERKGLSGGQRKRVSVAMELLSDPRILFLDEPTSGLSSHDTKGVVEQLREFASAAGVAVMVTIHQPSLQVYRLFDSVLYLKAGKLVYYGPSYPDSMAFFCPDRPPDEAGPDGIMEVLDSADPKSLYTSFAATPQAQRFLWARLDGGDGVDPVRTTQYGRRKITSLFVQCRAVLKRDVVARSRNVGTLVVLSVQPVLVGLLLGMLFQRPDLAAKFTVAFLAALVCFWFGLNASVREVVAERTLYRREKRGGLMPEAYLLAKLGFLGGICTAQIIALLGLIALQIPELGWSLPNAIGFGLLISGAGIASGLAISAYSSSQLAAVSTIPLLLIPVILLGGFVKSYKELEGVALSRVLSDLMPVRWGYEGFCAMLDISTPFFGAVTVSAPVLALGVLTVTLTGVTLLRLRAL